jgi:antitoxin component HigA of HigAB toxin-antitoxin module
MAMNKTRLMNLFDAFPPRVIDSKEAYEATLEVVRQLMVRPDLDETEEDYANLLGALIHEWEEQHEHFPDISGPELIRVLLRERGNHQRELVSAGIFPTESVASEVLSGRRPFRLEHLLAAAQFFDLPPAVFLPDRQPTAA